MTVEALLVIVGLCLALCYFVFEYQKAATPPYQEPLKPEADMVDQWVAAAPAAELEPTPLNPQAAWPFPRGPKP